MVRLLKTVTVYKDKAAADDTAAGLTARETAGGRPAIFTYSVCPYWNGYAVAVSDETGIVGYL